MRRTKNCRKMYKHIQWTRFFFDFFFLRKKRRKKEKKKKEKKKRFRPIRPKCATPSIFSVRASRLDDWGPKPQEMEEGGDYTDRYTLTTTMISVFMWAE